MLGEAQVVKHSLFIKALELPVRGFFGSPPKDLRIAKVLSSVSGF